MSDHITIGRRLVLRNQIALVEPFEPGANASFQPTRNYASRLVMLNRDSLLIEDAVGTFASAHGFTVLPDDTIAINPAVRFQVETFAPTDGFKPTGRHYRTRLRWRDPLGNDQSKLLATEPEQVLKLTAGPGNATPGKEGQPATRRRRKANGYSLHP